MPSFRYVLAVEPQFVRVRLDGGAVLELDLHGVQRGRPQAQCGNAAQLLPDQLRIGCGRVEDPVALLPDVLRDGPAAFGERREHAQVARRWRAETG